MLYDGARSNLVQGVPALSRGVGTRCSLRSFSAQAVPWVCGCVWGRPCRGAGQALTEHGVQAHEAADEAVKVDVHVLVGVAHGDDVVELVVEPKPCREAQRGHSWASGQESAAAP